jgi:hypothetical protein
MRLRVFQVAKELKLEPRDFFALARQSGLKLEKSMLAIVTLEQRNLLIEYVRHHPHWSRDNENP